MTTVIVIGLFVVWYLGLFVAKEMEADAQQRHEDRIMDAYLRREAARWHAQQLANIDRAAVLTVVRMVRATAQARSDGIEGAAAEVEPR
jgi:hypothetical protein